MVTEEIPKYHDFFLPICRGSWLWKILWGSSIITPEVDDSVKAAGGKITKIFIYNVILKRKNNKKRPGRC